MDKINIKGLICFGNHGVLKEEQVLGQKFVINATLYLDAQGAAMSGNLENTVNYAEICHRVKSFVEGNTFELIETLAEKIARDLLRTYTILKKVDIEVQKPWAPIGLPLDTVSVEITRERHTVYIALGSNMGDKKAYLDSAVAKLNALGDFKVITVSDYIETEPYGGVEQDNFLNGVLEGETLMSPMELLDALHEIESLEGRTRTIHWGPRTLDLDIIFYDDMVIDSKDLTVPHKEMHLRDFVLTPMNQIAPWFRHPVLNKTVENLLDELR